MTAFALGVASGVVVFWAAWIDRCNSSRLPVVTAKDSTPHDGPLTWLGRQVLVRLRAVEPRLVAPWGLADAPTLGLALAVAVPLTLVQPVMAMAVLVGIAAQPYVRRRQATRRRQLQIEAELPFMTELVRIAVDSGLNVTLALAAVVTHIRGPLSEELERALREIGSGRRLSAALDDIPQRAGDCTRPLIGGLLAAERYGSPLSSVLERLALESRAEQGRRAERAAKRLTVYLLFPLAGCTLPAFALLTVAPLLAGSIGSLAFF